jgi:hypothetical protein
MPPVLSDWMSGSSESPAASAAGAGNQAEDGEQDGGADEGDDDLADYRARREPERSQHVIGEPPAQHQPAEYGAKDADHDVTDDSVAMAGYEPAGQEAGHQADECQDQKLL